MMMKKNKLAFLLLFIVVGSFMLQSCATGKNCGCGGDLNRAYKSPKRH